MFVVRLCRGTGETVVHVPLRSLPVPAASPVGEEDRQEISDSNPCAEGSKLVCEKVPVWLEIWEDISEGRTLPLRPEEEKGEGNEGWASSLTGRCQV